MTAYERMIALIKPEYLERIPSFVREHAEECSCQLIAREHPDLLEIFSKEEEPDEDAKRQMSEIVNKIVAERIENHHKQKEK